MRMGKQLLLVLMQIGLVCSTACAHIMIPTCVLGCGTMRFSEEEDSDNCESFWSGALPVRFSRAGL